MVLSEVNGTWHKATRTTGITAKESEVSAASCTSVGNCVVAITASDFFLIGSDHIKGTSLWAASEVNGVWRPAVKIPGMSKLNTGNDEEITALSCGARGYCTLGGNYTDKSTAVHPFLASEHNGVWQSGFEVAGTGTSGTLTSVACPSATTCSASGSDFTSLAHPESGFVVNEVNGRWQKATPVPGLSALSNGQAAFGQTGACSAVGQCVTGGEYGVGASGGEPFVASEVNGTWRKAIKVPGIDVINTQKLAELMTVSCATKGNCSAGGWYVYGSQMIQGAFVVNEVNGVWGKAMAVPGIAQLNLGEAAVVTSISCTKPGVCSAAGDYYDSSFHPQGFVVDEVNGVWGKAIAIPGLVALTAGGVSDVAQVACGAPTSCAVGGSWFAYGPGTPDNSAFISTRR